MSSIGNNKISLFIMLMFISKLISAQELKAGFDKNEYLEILNVSAHSHADTNYTKKFDKPTKKAQRNYQKYLGKMASNIVRESLPNYNAPKYVNSNNYVRTGAYIVLQPDEMYYKKFNEKNSHVFVHHLHEPYVYLTKKLLSSDQDTVHSSSK